MWFYRRILRIPWTAHQTNVSVLQRMGQVRKLLCCIEQRQLKFLGHVIRKGEHEDLALSSRIPRKRARSAQRSTFIHNFKDLCKNPGKLLETARNRTQWKNITVHRGLDQPWYRKRESWIQAVWSFWRSRGHFVLPLLLKGKRSFICWVGQQNCGPVKIFICEKNYVK